MRRFLLVLVFAFIALQGFAQGREVKLPLRSNRTLSKESAPHISVTTGPNLFSGFGKQTFNAGIYPFIDWFTDPSGVLLDSMWVPGFTTLPGAGSAVIFNALDALNNVHQGARDTLRSRPFAFFPQNPEPYFQFTYSTGSTWNPGDSLVLFLKTSGGTYSPIWSSAQSIQQKTEVIQSVPELYNYTGQNFDFEWVCYTTNTLSNSETFLLHNITLTDKWNLPAYENFFQYDTRSRMPASAFWMKRQALVKGNVSTGKGNSNAVVFDGYDEYGQVYHLANGQFGNSDTLMSHMMNISQFPSTDSIVFRFYVKALPNALPGDSLILEFRNKNDIWVQQWSMTGIPTNTFGVVAKQVNFGKFPGPKFQFRFISKCHYAEADSMKFMIAGLHIGKIVGIPFFEDFSTSHVYPDQTKWQTYNTYINNDFPIRPPSYNVATFDALDRYGNAYTSGNRYSDTLTSVPINLSFLNPSDTNVYISFWVEPKGRGDLPNAGDSLLLDFRASSTEPESFVNVWKSARDKFKTDTFIQVIVRIDSTFFHDGFQFRFKNMSDKYGNLNHWHLDYIRLNNEPLNSIAYYTDISLSAASGSLITPYSSMPYDHFSINPTSFLKSSQQMTINNNAAIATPIHYNREIFDPSGTRIDSIGSSIGSLTKNMDITLPAITNPLSWTPTGDSSVFRTRYTGTAFNTGNNYIPYNDSLSIKTIFSNYYAYDDGTAENGYAVENTTGSVALAYNLTKPDKIYGVSMFFNQSVSDVSSKSFDLMLWNNINTKGNGTGEDLKQRFSLMSPVYKNTINGFYYYKFITPIDMAAGKFYIGWTQNQVYNLNVGLDENFQINGDTVNHNMFYFLDDLGVWQQTALTGALMIRPIIGKWVDPPVGVANIIKPKELHVTLYPNPASDYLQISDNSGTSLDVEISDLSGRVVLQQRKVTDRVSLPSFSEGLYFVKVTNPQGESVVKKIIIRP